MAESRPATGQPPASRVRGAVELAARHLQERPLLVVSDFDGTLSRIVDDPWGATILPAGRRALRALAGLPQVHVAVLSGRTAVDAARRVRVGGVTYLGNHGMERAFLRRGAVAEHLRAEVDEAAHEAVHAAQRLADEVPLLVPEPWLVVERKPQPSPSTTAPRLISRRRRPGCARQSTLWIRTTSSSASLAGACWSCVPTARWPRARRSRRSSSFMRRAQCSCWATT